MNQNQINRLEVVLVEQGQTGKWLVKQLGQDPSTVSLWCSNKTQPSFEMLDKIATILGVGRCKLINKSKLNIWLSKAFLINFVSMLFWNQCRDNKNSECVAENDL